MYSIFLVLLAVCFVCALGQMGGGWSDANFNDPNIQAIAQYAMTQKYPADPNAHFTIISAQQQV
jgi:hypothetical protein